MPAAATSRWRPTAGCARRGEREVVPFVYAGAAILTPGFFAGAPAGAFSLTPLFDRAAEAERLCGLRLEGVWMHVGTPEASRPPKPPSSPARRRSALPQRSAATLIDSAMRERTVRAY